MSAEEVRRGLFELPPDEAAREFERADEGVRLAAEQLLQALERRACIREANPRVTEDARVTPIVFVLLRWSRWRDFNMPAAGVGPFFSTDAANKWITEFNVREGFDPDTWHAEEWYALVPPAPPPAVSGRGGTFAHAWRRTKRVICNAPAASRPRASRQRARRPRPDARASTTRRRSRSRPSSRARPATTEGGVLPAFSDCGNMPGHACL